MCLIRARVQATNSEQDKVSDLVEFIANEEKKHTKKQELFDFLAHFFSDPLVMQQYIVQSSHV
jgi:hypothetical protein